MNLLAITKLHGQLKALPPGAFKLGAFSKESSGCKLEVHLSPEAVAFLDQALPALGLPPLEQSILEDAQKG